MSATLSSQSRSVSRVVHEVLTSTYGRLRHGAEFLARDAQGTPRAAQNWLDGANTPNAEKLVNIMRACPELRAAIFQLIEEGE
ncbi:hypothetical protein HMPREF9946_02210 [Acetobacteraceae bacterium AT-5844]|nr:hypothetical protein HMPREF9946_02210 [Acetobacteraceae bacterium AT-5844]